MYFNKWQIKKLSFMQILNIENTKNYEKVTVYKKITIRYDYVI